jgi:hypothetical protein
VTKKAKPESYEERVLREAAESERKLKQACPCCGRNVEKTYRAKWYGSNSIEQVDFPCYACKFNVFPPNHELFDRVQEWRRQRNMTVRTPKPGEVALANTGSPGAQNPEWLKLRDEQEIEKELRLQRSGMLGARIECGGCGAVVEKPIIAEESSLDDGKLERRLTWTHVGCVEESNTKRREAYASLLKGAWVAKWYAKDGRDRGELLGYFVHGKGFYNIDREAWE